MSQDIENGELLEKIDQLENSIDILNRKFDRALSKRYLVRDIVARAIATALGATIGIAIILLLLNFIIQYFQIPIIQELAKEIVEHIPERF